MSFLFYPGFVRSSTESGSCDHVLWCGTSPCCVHSWAQTCWCHPQPLCMLTRSSHECLLTVEFCHSFILFAKVQLFGLSKYCSLFKRQTCILFHVWNKNLSISFFFFFPRILLSVSYEPEYSDTLLSLFCIVMRKNTLQKCQALSPSPALLLLMCVLR